MTNSNNLFGEINAYAMRDGIWLGLVGMLTLAAWRMTLLAHIGDFLFITMLWCGPIVGTCLTWHYRRAVVGNGYFSFMRGFLHALFMGFYASIWVALGIFIYLRYFDHGMIFSAYATLIYSPEGMESLKMLSPEWSNMLEMLSGGKGAQGLAETFQSIGYATYATMPIYAAFFIGPVISVVIGLICRKQH